MCLCMFTVYRDTCAYRCFVVSLCLHMCILCIYVHLTALICPKQLLYRQLVCFSINQLQILP